MTNDCGAKITRVSIAAILRPPDSSGTDHEHTGNDFATTPASLHTEPVDVTTIKSGESVRVPNSERVVACPGFVMFILKLKLSNTDAGKLYN